MSADNTTELDSATGLSASELELLTPEERAAIEDGADDAAEQEALSRIAANAPEDDGADDDEGDSTKDDAPAAEAAPADGAAEVVEPEPAHAPEPKPAPVRAAYTAELPPGIELRQKEISNDLGMLREKFKAGEIEVDEYETRRDSLLEKRDEINKAITKAEISREMQLQTAEQDWIGACNRAFEAALKPENGGIDYRNDPAKLADMDLFARRLAADNANADKSMDWFLAEAHRRVKAMYGIATDAPAPAAPAAPAQTRKAPLASAPKTLAQVPGADGPGDVAGEFTDLDALDGEALEAAVARLSPAQRAKYELGR